MQLRPILDGLGPLDGDVRNHGQHEAMIFGLVLRRLAFSRRPAVSTDRSAHDGRVESGEVQNLQTHERKAIEGGTVKRSFVLGLAVVACWAHGLSQAHAQPCGLAEFRAGGARVGEPVRRGENIVNSADECRIDSMTLHKCRYAFENGKESYKDVRTDESVFQVYWRGMQAGSYSPDRSAAERKVQEICRPRPAPANPWQPSPNIRAAAAD